MCHNYSCTLNGQLMSSTLQAAVAYVVVVVQSSIRCDQGTADSIATLLTSMLLLLLAYQKQATKLLSCRQALCGHHAHVQGTRKSLPVQAQRLRESSPASWC